MNCATLTHRIKYYHNVILNTWNVVWWEQVKKMYSQGEDLVDIKQIKKLNIFNLKPDFNKIFNTGTVSGNIERGKKSQKKGSLCSHSTYSTAIYQQL